MYGRLGLEDRQRDTNIIFWNLLIKIFNIHTPWLTFRYPDKLT